MVDLISEPFAVRRCADCVEVAPSDSSLVVLAGYELDVATGERHGSLQLVRASCDESRLRLTELRNYDCPGVLDCKWCVTQYLHDLPIIQSSPRNNPPQDWAPSRRRRFVWLAPSLASRQ